MRDFYTEFISFKRIQEYYKNHVDYGIPYAPSTDKRVKIMLELARIKQGESMIDLGSGDGKLVLAFAKAGAYAHGIEINRTLFTLSQFKIKRNRIVNRAHIKIGDFWEEDLSSYDIITIYGLGTTMIRLEEKIKREAKKNCRILSNVYPFPNLKPLKFMEKVYLYVK